MNIIAVIPARYKSSRFPGKPLADIHGKPMIWWVYTQAKKVEEISRVIVATDDERIFSACTKLGMDVVMTADTHPTGTDRVCEIADLISADVYVNVQGDEPMLDPETIRAAIRPFLENQDVLATNLMARIHDISEAIDVNVPKVVVNSKSEGVYLSRLPIPYPKGADSKGYYRQVCVYGFSRTALQVYKENPKEIVESIEDIEILRLIERGVPVKFIEVNSGTVAVDTMKDLEKVRHLMKPR